MEGQHGRQAGHLELVEGAPGAFERVGAGRASDDDLREQGVERPGDDVAGGHPGVDADAGAAGEAQRVDRAGGGHEVPRRVLTVDPELDGVALGDGVAVVERAALGDAELLADEVDPGDLLGDRVLDLEPGVHLEEGDGAVAADEELAGAGADVADLPEDRLRALHEEVLLLLAEERRGGLLDELLVAALQRAVAGRHDDDVPVGIGEALRLDVARPVEVLLDEAFGRGRTPRSPRGPPTRRLPGSLRGCGRP